MENNLNKLYFGIRLFSMSYSTKSEQKLETYNLFDFSRVKWSVAKYATMDEKQRSELVNDPLRFCFGDVWSRVEYEYLVRPVVSDEGETIKVDVYQMYVEPNRELLMEMVNSVSKSSAEEYLRNERKRLHRS